MNSVMPQTHHTAIIRGSTPKTFLRMIPNYLVIYLATLIDILEPLNIKSIRKRKRTNDMNSVMSPTHHTAFTIKAPTPLRHFYGLVLLPKGDVLPLLLCKPYWNIIYYSQTFLTSFSKLFTDYVWNFNTIKCFSLILIIIIILTSHSIYTV